MKKILFLILFFLLFLCTGIEAEPLSYIPQVYLSGYGGYDDWTGFFKADILAPLFLRNNKIIYAYGQGRYGYSSASWAENTWTGSLGVGYRQMALIKNYPSILGAYLIGDYSNTATGQNLHELNLGLESLGFNWDFRLNGYLPIGKKRWDIENWADNFGDYDYVSFTGHEERDAWFVYHEETGIGADAELGRKLFTVNNMEFKAYANGYFYNMYSHDDLYGGGARLTFKPNSYLEFSLSDSYDNYKHNVIMAGVRIALNKINKMKLEDDSAEDDESLQGRLFDPIERSFASISSGNIIPNVGGPDMGADSLHARGHTDPVVDPYNNHNAPERDNVWFFSGGNTAGDSEEDGTYEHPYQAGDFDQDVLKHIYQYSEANSKTGADLFFNPGIYNVNNVDLYAGQSIWGRMGDSHKEFVEPAKGDIRPLFLGSFQITNDNHILDSIRIQNDEGKFATGISIKNAANITISNTAVGTKDNSNGFRTGISMDNSDVILSHSEITGYEEGANGIDVAGIKMINGGKLQIDASNINAVATGSINNNSAGIHADGHGNKVLIKNNSKVSGESKMFGVGENQIAFGRGYGIFFGGDETVSGNQLLVDHSQIIGTSDALGDSGGNDYSGYGILFGSPAVTADNQSFKIFGNEIDILGSTVAGISQGKDIEAHGDGYGMLIGVGRNPNIANHASVTVGADGSNKVNISDSSLMGSSLNLWGDGYGILIGVNRFYTPAPNHTASLNITVANNEINVLSSEISGKGGTTFQGSEGEATNNGFGILIGAHFLDLREGQNALNVIGNTVSLGRGTKLIGIGSASQSDFTSFYDGGNGFGLLIGLDDMDSISGPYGLTYTFNVQNNAVLIDQAEITASGNAGDQSKDYWRNSGFGYGVFVGVRYCFQEGMGHCSANVASNKLQVSNSKFQIASPRAEGWGIYMANGSNVLSVDGNNVFIRTDGGVTGGKIHWPDGNVQPWG